MRIAAIAIEIYIIRFGLIEFEKNPRRDSNMMAELKTEVTDALWHWVTQFSLRRSCESSLTRGGGGKGEEGVRFLLVESPCNAPWEK